MAWYLQFGMWVNLFLYLTKYHATKMYPVLN